MITSKNVDYKADTDCCCVVDDHYIRTINNSSVIQSVSCNKPIKLASRKLHLITQRKFKV